MTQDGKNDLSLRRAASLQADIIAKSGLFDHRWYLDRHPDVRGTDAIAQYLATGAAEGRDPGPGFSTSWYLSAYPDVAAEGLNPLVHYALYGRAEGRTVLAPGIGPPAAATRLRIGGDVLGPWLEASRGRWGAVAAFAAAHRGHALAVVVEGDLELPVPFDAWAGGAALMFAVVGEALGASGILLADARYTDAATLTLTLSDSGGSPGAIEAYQALDGALVSLARRPIDPPSPDWPIALADPLLPLLLVHRDAAGAASDASVLVFPSLLPGGLHADEARALALRQAPRVDVGRALAIAHLGTHAPRVAALEGALSPPVTRWFDAVFRRAGDDGEPTTLRLGEGATPCIAALTAALAPATGGIGTGWIATRGDGTVRALVALPATGAYLPASLDPPAALAVPLAIVHPVATAARPPVRDLGEAGGVTVIVDRTRHVDVAALIESIAEQQGVAAVEIVLLGDAAPPAIPSPLAGRVRSGGWPDATRAIVVRVDASVRLPDPATLGVLAAALADPAVGAASCLQETPERPGAGLGGDSPVTVALGGRPGVVVREVALPLGTLPPALPMLALSHRLIAVRHDAAAALRDRADADAALLFGVETIEAGHTNLLATGVVAVTVLAPDLSERVDPVSPAVLSPERIAALLDRIAVVTQV